MHPFLSLYIFCTFCRVQVLVKKCRKFAFIICRSRQDYLCPGNYVMRLEVPHIRWQSILRVSLCKFFCWMSFRWALLLSDTATVCLVSWCTCELWGIGVMFASDTFCDPKCILCTLYYPQRTCPTWYNLQNLQCLPVSIVFATSIAPFTHLSRFSFCRVSVSEIVLLNVKKT